MIHLKEELQNGAEIPEAFDFGETVPVLLPLLQDFQDTWLDFQTKTLKPVISMMRQGIRQGWALGLNRLKSFWQQTRSSKNPFAAKPVGKPQKLTEPLKLYRVQGALGYHWAFPDKDANIRIIPGQENPWLSGDTRISKVGKTYQTRQQLRMANRQSLEKDSQSGMSRVAPLANTPSQAPTVEDEILGLDDIFTEPVETSFLDVVAPRGKKSVIKKSVAKCKVNASFPKNEREIPEQTETTPSSAISESHDHIRHAPAEAIESTEGSESSPSHVVLYVLPAVGEPEPIKLSNAEVKVGNAALSLDTEAEVSGCEWMVRNNQILSRSISNLVEQYFDQSSKAESI